MTDRIWPVDIIPGSQEWGIVDNVGSFQSPLSGSVRTVSRPGARMGCRISVPPMKGQSRARVMAAIAGMRQSDRIWMPDYSTTSRGSMPSTELLSNSDFSNGTTGWASFDADSTISVFDGALRSRLIVGGGDNWVSTASAVTTVQYAPYAVRALIVAGRQSAAYNYAVGVGSVNGSTSYAAAVSGAISTSALRIAAGVVPATTAFAGCGIAALAGGFGGDYFSVPYISLARCALVDNGPNSLLQSSALDNAAWTATGLSARGANVAVGPDGASLSDTLVENSSNSTHSIDQIAARSAVATDLCAYGYFGRGAGTRDVVLTVGNDGTNYGSALFNLGAGTYGTVTNAGTATNTRAFMVDAGAGYYFCAVVSRAASAATMRAFVQMANGASVSYLGNGTSSIIGYKVGMSVSGVPTRGGQTTASALPTGATQTGSGLYLKGLPASTTGLRRAGDPVQVGGQINFLTESLDSDAAGLGYMRVGLPWRTPPADNDPVIFNTPMALMRLAGDIRWTTGPGQFSGFELDLVEDVT